jgi:hypothetical protein
MESISEFIHYNIFRNMCDSQINQTNNSNNNNEIKTDDYKKPDIEMGYKQASTMVTPPKKVTKPIVFDTPKTDVLVYRL